MMQLFVCLYHPYLRARHATYDGNENNLNGNRILVLVIL